MVSNAIKFNLIITYGKRCISKKAKTSVPVMCNYLIYKTLTSSNCKPFGTNIFKAIINQLDTTQWIAIFHKYLLVQPRCKDQEEIMKVIGSFLITIPRGCQIRTDFETIFNRKIILFPSIP